MVNNVDDPEELLGTEEPEESEESVPAPLEWRRHFYDARDGVSLILAVLSSCASVPFFALCFFASHKTIVLIWLGCGFAMLGFGVMMAIHSRTFSNHANAVSVDRGVIVVKTRMSDEPGFGAAILGVGLGLFAIGALAAVHTGVLPEPDAGIIFTIAAWGSLGGMVAMAMIGLAYKPFARTLEFTPEELRCDFGISQAVIPWTSIVDTRFYQSEASRWIVSLGIQDGVQITTTNAAQFSGTAFPILKGYFPFALTSYTVDEDTLFTVIQALHGHPELRELIGREEGTALFDGPSRSVRQGMSRTQVWLPWERKIKSLLGLDEYGGTSDKLA